MSGRRQRHQTPRAPARVETPDSSIPRIAFDKDISGLTAILGALASVVAIFVYGRRKDAEERREKRSEFTSPQLRLPYDETAPETDRSSRANDRGAPG